MRSAAGDRVTFRLRPVHGARGLDAATAERIGRVTGADGFDLRADGSAAFDFDRASDAATIRGHLEMAARFELGAHWHTRYEVVGE